MDNIILIGMPGAGKSTVGVVLAKTIGYRFIDSDLLIQEKEGRLLSEIIGMYGDEGFRKIENDINLSINVTGAVIATGGSAVYGTYAMEHLKKTGIVVYLKHSYKEIEERLGDLGKRGVTIRKGQTLKDLYDERIPLYEKYADVTIECDNKYIRTVVREIREKIRK